MSVSAEASVHARARVFPFRVEGAGPVGGAQRHGEGVRHSPLPVELAATEAVGSPEVEALSPTPAGTTPTSSTEVASPAPAEEGLAVPMAKPVPAAAGATVAEPPLGAAIAPEEEAARPELPCDPKAALFDFGAAVANHWRNSFALALLQPEHICPVRTGDDAPVPQPEAAEPRAPEVDEEPPEAGAIDTAPVEAAREALGLDVTAPPPVSDTADSTLTDPLEIAEHQRVLLEIEGLGREVVGARAPEASDLDLDAARREVLGAGEDAVAMAEEHAAAVQDALDEPIEIDPWLPAHDPFEDARQPLFDDAPEGAEIQELIAGLDLSRVHPAEDPGLPLDQTALLEDHVLDDALAEREEAIEALSEEAVAGEEVHELRLSRACEQHHRDEDAIREMVDVELDAAWHDAAWDLVVTLGSWSTWVADQVKLTLDIAEDRAQEAEEQVDALYDEAERDSAAREAQAEAEAEHEKARARTEAASYVTAGAAALRAWLEERRDRVQARWSDARQTIADLWTTAIEVAQAIIEGAAEFIVGLVDWAREHLLARLAGLLARLDEALAAFRHAVASLLAWAKAELEGRVEQLAAEIRGLMEGFREAVLQSLAALRAGAEWALGVLQQALDLDIMGWLREHAPAIAALLEHGLSAPVEMLLEQGASLAESLFSYTGLDAFFARIGGILGARHEGRPVLLGALTGCCECVTVLTTELLQAVESLLGSDLAVGLREWMTDLAEARLPSFDDVLLLARDVGGPLWLWWQGLLDSYHKGALLLGCLAQSAWAVVSQALGLEAWKPLLDALRDELDRRWQALRESVLHPLRQLRDFGQQLLESLCLKDLVGLVASADTFTEVLYQLWGMVQLDPVRWFSMVVELLRGKPEDPFFQALGGLQAAFEAAMEGVEGCVRGFAEQVGALWLLDLREETAARASAEWQALLELGSATLSWAAGSLGSLYQAIKPLLDVATAVGLLIATKGATAPLLAIGLGWRLLPECSKLGFADFIIDLGLKLLKHAVVPDSPVQVFLASALEAFLINVKAKPPEEKVLLLDRFVAMASLTDFEMVAGFIIGAIGGLLDGTLGLLLTLLQLVIWLVKLPLTLALLAAKLTTGAAVSLYQAMGGEMPAGTGSPAEVGTPIIEADTPDHTEGDEPVYFDPMDPVADEPGAEVENEDVEADPGAPPPDAPPILEELRKVFERLIAGDITRAELEELAAKAREQVEAAGTLFGQKAADVGWAAAKEASEPFRFGLVVGYVVGVVVAEVTLMLLTAYFGGGTAWLSGIKWGSRGVKGAAASADKVPGLMKWAKSMLESAKAALGEQVGKHIDSLLAYLRRAWAWLAAKVRHVLGLAQRGARHVLAATHLTMAARSAAHDAWKRLGRVAGKKLVEETALNRELAKVRARRGRIRISLNIVWNKSSWKVRATARQGLRGRRHDVGEGFVTRDGHPGDGRQAGKALPESQAKPAQRAGKRLFTTQSQKELGHAAILDDKDRRVRRELERELKRLGDDAPPDASFKAFKDAAGDAAQQGNQQVSLSNVGAYIVFQDEPKGGMVRARLVISPNDTWRKKLYRMDAALVAEFEALTKARAEQLHDKGWAKKLREEAGLLGWSWPTPAEKALEAGRDMAVNHLPDKVDADKLRADFASSGIRDSFDDAFSEALATSLREHIKGSRTAPMNHAEVRAAASEKTHLTGHSPKQVMLGFPMPLEPHLEAMRLATAHRAGTMGDRSEGEPTNFSQLVHAAADDHPWRQENASPRLDPLQWSPPALGPDKEMLLAAAWLKVTPPSQRANKLAAKTPEQIGELLLVGSRPGARLFHEHLGSEAPSGSAASELHDYLGTRARAAGHRAPYATYTWNQRRLGVLSLTGEKAAADRLKAAVSAASVRLPTAQANVYQGVVGFMLQLAMHKVGGNPAHLGDYDEQGNPRPGGTAHPDVVTWPEFDNHQQLEVSWHNSTNRRWLGREFRYRDRGKHEWIPVAQIRNVIDTAHRALDLYEGAKWVLAQDLLRSPTNAIIFLPHEEHFTDEPAPRGFRTLARARMLDQAEHEEKFSAADMRLRGHAGAIKLGGTWQTGGQSDFHDHLHKALEHGEEERLGDPPRVETYLNNIITGRTLNTEVWRGQFSDEGGLGLKNLEEPSHWLRAGMYSFGRGRDSQPNLARLANQQTIYHNTMKQELKDAKGELEKVKKP